MLQTERRLMGESAVPMADSMPKRADLARLAAIVESSDDAIIGKTLDGIVTSWNKGAERIFGYTAEELIGQNISKLIPPGREEEEPGILERLARGERVDHFDTVRVTKSGEMVHVSLTISPIRDETGRIVGASKIARDIGDRKLAEENLRARDASLAHLSRVSTMGNMAAGLAHELSQPLAAIMNYAGVCLNLARMGSPSGEKVLFALEEVMNETRRAGAIISRLRAFVSKQAPRSAAVDLNGLMRKSIELLGFHIRGTEVEVELHLASGLRPVLADEIQIEQVMVNLIYNAMQAMGEKPVSARRLIVETRSIAKDLSEVVVTDFGKGLSQEEMGRLFEPFFTTKPEGLGMGLNISRSIVASHGGCLSASANPAGGMRFAFTLPFISEVQS